MSEAVRVGDLTNHSMPIKGSGSPDVFIGGEKAWRGLPAGVGDGLDQASKSVKQIMEKPPFTPPEVMPQLPTLATQMVTVAGQAEAAGAIGATTAVSAAFTPFTPQAALLASTYVAGAAVPGGEPAARATFTKAFQAGLSQAMTTAVHAIAGPWDMHTCQQAGPAGPHGPGVVIKACQTVFINGLPAVMKGQEIVEAVGGVSTIQMGCGTVFIGDKAPGGGGGKATNKRSSTAFEEGVKNKELYKKSNTHASAPEQGSPGEKDLRHSSSEAKGFDEQLQLIDETSGEPLIDYPYAIVYNSQVVARGRTDKDGKTSRVFSGAGEATMDIVLGVEALKVC